MKLKDEWITATIEDDKARLILVTLRDNLQEFYISNKLKYYITIDYPYTKDENGFPYEQYTKLFGDIEDAIRKVMEKDKLAICIINSIGVGLKSWAFVCRHLKSFEDRLNLSLSSFPKLPLQIDVVEDTSWGEYHELLEIAKSQDID